MFVIAYERDSVDENQLLYEMARYNFTSFTVRNFDIAVEKGDGIDMMQVRTFQNYDEAYIYMHRLFNNADIAVNENREQEMIDQQTLSEVRGLIAKLPDAQREVLLMRVYDELSFKEIAQKTNCSINTALGRMRYAILNLRHMVAEQGISMAS